MTARVAHRSGPTEPRRVPAAIAGRGAGNAGSRTVFVTGTDTGVGKTHVACALLRSARAAGIDAVGFKPVAAGSRRTARGLRNADALALMRAAETAEPYEAINPFALSRPIAPHLAAREDGVRIDPRRLDAAHDRLAGRHELVLVEGAGGWLVPLSGQGTMADWVAGRRWPVVLVVGMRLGCLNHALLSAEAIARRTRLAGWIANVLPPRQPFLDDNIAELTRRMPAPLLGVAAGRSTRLDDTLRTLLSFFARPQNHPLE